MKEEQVDTHKEKKRTDIKGNVKRIIQGQRMEEEM